MALTPKNVVVWYGKTPAEHKALLDKWADEKFRTLSLSLYGSRIHPLYAAVMVKRPKLIAESQFGPVDQAGMQKAFDDMVKIGRGPYILTATGPASEPIFAGCFRPMPKTPLTRLNLTGKQFADLCADQQAKGNILIWADAFGSASNTHYTAIWGPNPLRQAWNCDAIDEKGDALQARYVAMRSMWARPAHVSVTSGRGYLELFVDSTVGDWFSQVNMSADEFKQALEKQKKKGLQPVRVSAQTGAFEQNRYAAIFASREETDPRVFRAKGPRTVAAIDEAMKTYMQDHNLRGAALAITRGTQLVYAKGYTWAEEAPIYPHVLETTVFRQASSSKMFNSVAMWRLMQERPQDVQLDTPLQSILKLKQPDGSPPNDPRYGLITIQHLLESISGIKDQKTTWKSDEAVAAFKTSLPATHEQIASYSTSFDLTAEPGDTENVVYGGFDNFLLSQVIAKLAGTATFEQALTQLVLTPLGCTRTRGSRSLVDAQAADEARYHLSPLRLSPSVKSAEKPTVGYQYGGFDLELFDGAGGLSSAVVDVARLVAMFSCHQSNPVLTTQSIDELFKAAANATKNYTGPGKLHGFHGFDGAKVVDKTKHLYTANKGGKLPATGTAITFSTGGFGYVLAQNGNPIPDVKTKWDTVKAIAKAQSWPGEDLFPKYDMPSLLAGPIKIIDPKLVKLPG